MRPLRFAVLAVSLALVGILACGGPKPGLPSATLTSGRDSLHVRFGEITQAAWLGGDRWAVLSPLDRAIAIVDFGAHAVTPVGGSDTTQLQRPSVLFRLGDTIFVGDWALRRTTAWGPDGQLVRAIPINDATRGALPHAVDSAGNLYYEFAPPAKPDGSGNRDSAAVVRVAQGSAKIDTVARLNPLDLAEVMGDAGRRFERRVFSGQDLWGVLPDGSLWIARVYHNRIDWRDPAGRVTRGEPLPDRVLEVSRGDREMFVRRYPPELRSTAEQLPFAPIKPPFEAAFTAPGPRVWLEKSIAVVDSARMYHVVGRDGKGLQELKVPGYWTRIVAAGPTTALVAEPDSNGFKLTQAALPAPATAAR
jgi:hypothetical protein